MSGDFITVITTIQDPPRTIRRLDEALQKTGGKMVVVADKKGPAKFELTSATLLTLEAQLTLPAQLPGLLPVNHYARKNAGYLYAIACGAACVYDTDDDIGPGEHWQRRTLTVEAETTTARGWVNVFRHFTDELIWPRGFPLHHIRNESTWPQKLPATSSATMVAPIQQSLSDLSPDVDAVWRLVLEHDITFRQRSSVHLPAGAWCPFNSQATWWWVDAHPLLYLPSFCTFRMTDIWRGFVAQRCLWELGHGLVFHAPDNIQERNVHNLLRDFQDELPGYQHNANLVTCLEKLTLQPGPDRVGENLLACYERLVTDKFLPADELPLVRAWLADINSARTTRWAEGQA